ncbi:hypothetical protein VCB98_10745 [Gammaproteobacteria bacterium AB-CW1]|uniref:Uncharacterized protein n=1 Tax=Natronospira elongata TaxID=3110268 RepID=A0AAP6JFX4_9GAMM|nr:hypothetical protein [Gammaproteobacteria bacterium AB-CW1]MEA5446297.1 hypothetical protein [Gammaproteobacteria bacterium AB-CW1]
MEQCPYCNTEIEDGSVHCPKCRAEKGYAMRSNGSVRHEPIPLPLVALLVLVSSGIGVLMIYTGILGLREETDVWGIVVILLGLLFLALAAMGLRPQQPKWFRPYR